MWSIEKLEEIRDACMKDIVEIYPDIVHEGINSGSDL